MSRAPVIWLSAAALLLTACGESVPDAIPTVPIEECAVRGAGHLADCATLQVVEDRATGEGRSIGLRVVRLKASGSSTVADPLFMLAGGPGQSAIEAYPPMLAMLAAITQTRDIVFVDQRGTGSSNPLDCPVPDTLEENFRERAFLHIAKECLADLAGEPRHYSTASAADDLEEVRIALGYDRINVFGSSYGTRLALTYAQRHPGHLRSMILDAVAPPSLRIPLPLAKDAQRVLELIFERCASDADCAKAFPVLRDDFARALARFDEGPINIVVPDPRSGKATPITLSRDTFTGAIRAVLYSPELQQLLPLTIQRAARGEYDSFVAQASMFGDGMEEHMSIGLFLSVVCTEDLPRIDDADAKRQAQGTFFGDVMVRELRETCEIWPRGPLPKTIDDPITSDAPTLLLSGSLDPVTPPRWADETAKHLTTARHIVVEGMSHGVSIRGCIPHVLRDFLDAPSEVAELDADCIEATELPFFIDFAGPKE